MFMRFRTLRSRVLLLAGMLFTATLVLGLLYTLNISRFDDQIAKFKYDNLPRFEATFRLEDWTYSIQSGVKSFENARSTEELGAAYDRILEDIVNLESSASDQFNQTAQVSSLEMNRLIEGLKHSLNITLALKGKAFQENSEEAAEFLAPQLAVYEALLTENLSKLRDHAVENRTGSLNAATHDLIRLQHNVETDRTLGFGVLLAILSVGSFLVWRTVRRFRTGLDELRRVLMREQSGFSAQFSASPDEFTEIGRRVLHYIEQEKEFQAIQLKASEAELKVGAYESAISNLTHDLRTPASQISGLLELIEDQQSALGEPSREVLMAKSAARRLSSLLQDVLDLTRSEMGQTQPIMRAFDPVSMFDEIISSFQFSAKARNLELKFENRLSLTSVIQDDQKIERITANLIDNAIKYTNSGSVSLVVSDRFSKNGAPEIVIEVRDTGIGIPREQLDDIFQKFGRARNHYAIDGLGLGLALVSSFTELLGGNISVASTVSQGTSFTVAIPCEAPEEQALEETTYLSSDVGHSKPKVLLVDDDPFNLALASSILKSFSDVTCASDGQEAITAFQRNRPDVIIMDLRMPIINGLMATKEIRDWERQTSGGRTPIWGLSANATRKDRGSAIDAGMDELLAKPLSKAKVATILNQQSIDFASVS